jgi:hypothetical protein
MDFIKNIVSKQVLFIIKPAMIRLVQLAESLIKILLSTFMPLSQTDKKLLETLLAMSVVDDNVNGGAICCCNSLFQVNFHKMSVELIATYR